MAKSTNHIDQIFKPAGNHLTYSQMKSYLNDTLNKKEKRVIELHLASCTFCNEAINGLEKENDFSAFEASLANLQKKVSDQTQVSVPKIISLKRRYLAAAATILLLIAVSFMVYLRINERYSKEVFAQHYEKYQERDDNNNQQIPLVIDNQSIEDTSLSNEIVSKPIIGANSSSAPSSTMETLQENIGLEESNIEDEPLRIVDDSQPDVIVDSKKQSEAIFEESSDDEVNFNSTGNKASNSIPTAGMTDSIITIRANSDAPQTEFIEPVEISETVVQNGASNAKMSAYEIYNLNIEAAVSAYEEDRYQDCIHIADELILRDTADYRSRLYRGLAFLAIDNPTKAIRDFDVLIDNNVSTLLNDAMWYKALALLNKGRKRKAIALLKQIKASDSPYADEAGKTLDEM